MGPVGGSGIHAGLGFYHCAPLFLHSRSTNIHKALLITPTSSSEGQGTFLVLMPFGEELPPVDRPPSDGRLWSYFIVFLGRHVKANQLVYLSNEAHFMKL